MSKEDYKFTIKPSHNILISMNDVERNTFKSIYERMQELESRISSLEEKGKRTKFVVPTVQEVYEELKTKGIDSMDLAQYFWNFYDEREWMVGKFKMKKWKSALSRAVSTWSVFKDVNNKNNLKF